ncbi:MAG: glucosyltransferase domain-containing protein [Pseudobutyrivibrio sp.]|nr:glucosyltransferase domain-containing protein [Pseudobutyrivibrio sp.]
MDIFAQLKENKLVITWSIFISILCHGFRMSSLMYSHDSLFISQNDYLWQINLGRFGQRVVPIFRGDIVAPYLLCCLSIIYLIVTNIIIIKIFNITNKVEMVLVCGLIITNQTITLTYASYAPWVDIFTFSLLLSVLAIYFFNKGEKNNKYYIITIICIVGVLSLYQAYLFFSISLFVVLLFIDSRNGKTYKKYIIHSCVRALIVFAIASLAYYGLWICSIYIYNVEIVNSYNGLKNLSTVFSGGGKALLLLVNTYKEYINDLLNPTTFYVFCIKNYFQIVIKIVNIVVTVTIFVYGLKRRSIIRLLIIIIFPLSVYGINILSGGQMHLLMKAAFVWNYITFLLILFSGQYTSKKYSIINKVAVCIISLVIYSNIVYANQAYNYKRIQEQQTLSFITGLVTKIEQTEGYVVGETNVVFSGIPNIKFIDEFGFKNTTGFGTSAITYESILSKYLYYIINTDMVYVEADCEDITRDMPVYPSYGSIKMVDDVIYVKLSE